MPGSSHWGIHDEDEKRDQSQDGPSFAERKLAAQLTIEQINASLTEHVRAEIEKVTKLADEFGIVVDFTGLPPFDPYGNSGWYLPARANGSPWYSSDDAEKGTIPEQLQYHARESGWVSSSEIC